MTGRRRYLPLLLFLSVGPAMSEIRKEEITFAGATRTFHVFVPEGLPVDSPVPLLLLLHGSYQNGNELLGFWIPVAERHHVLLVAPDSVDEIGWQIKADGPAFIREVITAVSQKHRVDCRRLYLFGLSGGGVYSLTLAMIESDYFAASAVFAAAWRESVFFELPAVARRKIPVAILAGTRDPYFPIRSVRRTAAALEEAGHPVLLRLLERRGHAYAPVAQEVNAAVWSFLQPYALPGEPDQKMPDGCGLAPSP